MRVWIQSADFSTKEYELDEPETQELFLGHDWAHEIELLREKELGGKEWCDPGIGLVREDGQILHICPEAENTTVHYHRPEKILGLFRSRNRVLTRSSFPRSHVPKLISHFFRYEDHLLERIP